MMIQVSLVGFAVGGAFLSLVYYDVPYYLMLAMVATAVLVEQARAAQTATARQLAASDLLPQQSAAALT
jgi:hypothetical protein